MQGRTDQLCLTASHDADGTPTLSGIVKSKDVADCLKSELRLSNHMKYVRSLSNTFSVANPSNLSRTTE